MQPTNSPTAATTPQPVRRETRSLPVTAETNEIACLKEQFARQVSQVTIEHTEFDESRKALDKRAIEFDE